MKVDRNLTAVVVALLLSIAAMTAAKAGGRAAYHNYGADEGPPGAASLTLRRIPDLGHNVFVKLWIDGRIAGSLIYGHTYETYLPPGRHILWMAPSPDPKWHAPSEFLLDLRRNRAYEYTVASNHSGRLILKGD